LKPYFRRSPNRKNDRPHWFTQWKSDLELPPPTTPLFDPLAAGLRQQFNAIQVVGRFDAVSDVKAAISILLASTRTANQSSATPVIGVEIAFDGAMTHPV
jgi:hypothetical protein